MPDITCFFHRYPEAALNVKCTESGFDPKLCSAIFKADRRAFPSNEILEIVEWYGKSWIKLFTCDTASLWKFESWFLSLTRRSRFSSSMPKYEIVSSNRWCTCAINFMNWNFNAKSFLSNIETIYILGYSKYWMNI